jgi:hypothetical protein
MSNGLCFPSLYITSQYPTLKYLATILLFLSVLLSLRWGWSEIFSTSEHPHAVNGVLDMHGWDLEKSPTIPLDGQWEIYPEKLASHQDIQLAENQLRYIQVPGDWSSVLSKGSSSSFGYGTYRLRILADPLKQPVSFWFRGLQASSGVEMNGQVEDDIGKPAENANEYMPKNVSFTASYDVKGAKEIELLIRVANFEDPYNGGILRSIGFGSQAAIDYRALVLYRISTRYVYCFADSRSVCLYPLLIQSSRKSFVHIS